MGKERVRGMGRDETFAVSQSRNRSSLDLIVERYYSADAWLSVDDRRAGMEKAREGSRRLGRVAETHPLNLGRRVIGVTSAAREKRRKFFPRKNARREGRNAEASSRLPISRPSGHRGLRRPRAHPPGRPSLQAPGKVPRAQQSPRYRRRAEKSDAHRGEIFRRFASKDSVRALRVGRSAIGGRRGSASAPEGREGPERSFGEKARAARIGSAPPPGHPG
ncbi:hypothetical protein KM043_004834 [Ampulex compressa]|nr:hypothetical protein KM043_004834 [Ampulex compressa]